MKGKEGQGARKERDRERHGTDVGEAEKTQGGRGEDFKNQREEEKENKRQRIQRGEVTERRQHRGDEERQRRGSGERGEGSQAYMRWVLSGVQSGRYLAPSSRALSRSSERKGFWKPLSTTTTP